ncbi:uncharacterized protein B0I36DRAFT_367885 [Microdochium trichocladiopsis]|uniref:Zn(2)-C6 fungal-type domain-containing protein n=1 Tax=Microdochium trichocladiopsis TaxID=1682393 RepID=A0A9P9BKP9_9PEZI|nr:uncharacterized protein B0I36DRAFT_367885 [Microdochium trichocladiopsis]KAH7021479.1 hypothetical protein B0I36DRAFT_367885 [Microdochium trichocladiopsis]
MLRDSETTLRSTQRAPRSCRSCASRKIRCDKAVPCLPCTKRGHADACVRETVIVRGEVTTGRDVDGRPSYDELKQENERLRELLARRDSATVATTQAPRLTLPYEEYNEYEQLLFSVQGAPKVQRHAFTIGSVILPSRVCSNGMVTYDKQWNSWVHYAVEYPAFEEQHTLFMDALDAGVSLADMDAAWLAIYFSILTASILTMDDDHHRLQRNWYDAALFFLDRAEFMKRPRLETCQTIAILEISFSIFGDHKLSFIMRSCALTVARSLGLDRENPMDESQLTALGKEARRRLWWTLVICEWLSGPHPPSQLTEDDFDILLPVVDSSHMVRDGPPGLEIHPVQYHVFMAKTSIVYNRFRRSLRDPTVARDVLVRKADEELAGVIHTLPQHLSPDGLAKRQEEDLSRRYPWIRWQRVDVTLVLLHHRLEISRILQNDWQANPSHYGWARQICLGAAKEIIWISQNWEQSAAKRSQWALAWHVYLAAVFIISDMKASTANLSTLTTEKEDILQGIKFLDSVRARNVMAGKAADILRQLLGGGGIPQP